MKTQFSFSNQQIQTYGGIFFIHKAVKDAGLASCIDEVLGQRNSNVQYSFSEVFLSAIYTTLCGGTPLEDINILKEKSGNVFPIRLCSPDTVSYVCRELSEKARMWFTGRAIHWINNNIRCNELLVKAAKKLGTVGDEIDMDFDTVVLETEKKDARYTYKGVKGYQPAVAFAGKIPLFIQGRNGNTNAAYKVCYALEKCLRLLEDNDIRVKNFRGDCAYFQHDVIRLLKRRCENFFLRAKQCEGMLENIAAVTHWDEQLINGKTCELASVDYLNPHYKRPFRTVVQRIEREDGQIDLITGEPYTYRGILTNNRSLSDKHVVEFYNQRGGSERNFDFLNNDFNWGALPFSEMDENVVYMSIMALSMTLFEYVKEYFSKRIPRIRTSWRLKNFIFHLICIPCKLIKRSRKLIVKFFTHWDYQPLLR